ncbi:MAG TPA: hypothetical protein VFS21_25265 [Roseiflexaceae bacterium]|nr:hypothetical protein [Roseiflexaceae bacterium]
MEKSTGQHLGEQEIISLNADDLNIEELEQRLELSVGAFADFLAMVDCRANSGVCITNSGTCGANSGSCVTNSASCDANSSSCITNAGRAIIKPIDPPKIY